nr:TolC family protein [bacterium]
EARSMGLPQLTASGTYTRTWRRPEMIINGQKVEIGSNNYFQAGAEVSQLIWDGGRVIKAVRAARTEELRGVETIRDAEEMVRFQVKQAYYQSLYMDKVIGVLERQLGTLKGHLSSIKTRYDRGVDSDYALMRQRVEVANIEPELIDAKRVKGLLLNSLKILLAIPPEDAFVPSDRFSYTARKAPGAEALASMARNNRPDLAAEKLREQSLVQNVGVEKAGYWPKLAFTTSLQWQGYSGDWSVTPNERTYSFQSGVGLSWPIFDGLKTASRVRQAKAKLMQQHYHTAQMEDSVAKEVLDARETLLRARQALATQGTSYATARRAAEIAGERFEAGLLSQIELNDAITQQAKAEQLHLQATLDCLTAEAALEKAAGGQLWK